MSVSNVTDTIKYIGVQDRDIDLFEGQFVVPDGISYNSYVILDEKVAVMDTADLRKIDDYMANLEEALAGRTPDYLVIHHVEPDHASGFGTFFAKYPETKLVANVKTFQILGNYFDLPEENKVTVTEGDSLDLGVHQLHFILAPMVHWPEVMMTYESTEKVFFSADAFGKFGTLDAEGEWADEARRYYFNIVGKFGMNVQKVFAKLPDFDIQTVCALHGPVLSGDALAEALDLYQKWSTYTADTEGVCIAYCSMHGNMKKAAMKLESMLKAKGVDVEAVELNREPASEALEHAFMYDKLVLMAPSYYGSVMPAMEDFLHHLAGKLYQNRTVAVIEGGSWAPSAARTMGKLLEGMKNLTVLEQTFTMLGGCSDEKVEAAFTELVDALTA